MNRPSGAKSGYFDLEHRTGRWFEIAREHRLKVKNELEKPVDVQHIKSDLIAVWNPDL
jgi:hypothetical protein